MMAEISVEASEVEEMETNLPEVVAGMELLTVNTGESTRPRYSMRKRVPKMPPNESLNRRCSIKPKKRSYSTMESDSEIREYYLDKSWKKNQNTLETIYEEIDGMSENSTAISGRKFRRLIKFDDTKANDAKIRKRRVKIKRAFGSKIKVNSGTVTMQAFLKKLDAIRADQNLTKT